MRFKHTNLVLIVLLAALLITSKAALADEVPSNYRLAAASDVISLYIDDSTTHFLIQHNETKQIWYSVPPGSRTDKDTLSIIYYNPSDEMKTMNNFKDSIEIGMFWMEEIPGGISVRYQFGPDWVAEDWLPIMVPQDRFENEILPRLSEKDANWLKSKYKLTALVPVSEENPRLNIAGLTNQEQIFGDYVVVSPVQKLSDKDRTTLTLLLLDTIIGARDDVSERAEVRLSHMEQLIETPAYVIDNTIRPWDRTDIQNMMMSIGYTPDEIAKDHEANNIKPPVKNVEVFRITVEYIVDGDSLIVRIPMEEVYYPVQVVPNDRYLTGVSGNFRPTNRPQVYDYFGQIGGALVDFPLYSINVLPHFGASPTGKDGYIFIPDGSGALIDTKVATAVQYARDMYGTDNSVAYGLSEHQYQIPADRYLKERLYMPVFGLKEEDKAFMAVIEEGHGMARVKANTASNTNPFAKVSSEYVLLPLGRISLTTTSRTEELERRARGQINSYAKSLPNEDIVIRYTFLTGDEANYVGMALRFQEHLVGKYNLTRIDPKEDLPFYVELIGAIPVRKSIMGFPRDVITPLTTFNQVRSIVSELLENQVKNIQVRYLGWREGGMYPPIPSRVRLEAKLGTNQEFNELVSYLADNDVGFYPDVDFLNIYNDEIIKVDLKRDVAQSLNRQPVWMYRDKEMLVWVLSPSQLDSVIQKFMGDYQKFNIGGLSLGDLGSQINSDFDLNNPVSRADALVINQNAMRRLNEEYKLDLMINKANVYAVPYASHLVNVPLTANNYNIVGRSVPFYQIVMHGYVNYAGYPLNHAADYDYAVLKLVETGAVPYFSWMYTQGTTVKETEYDYLFPNHYLDWLDMAIDTYQELNAVLRQVQGQRIIDHQMLAENLYMTCYENGLAVIVNYNKDTVEYRGIELEGMSFKLIREGDLQ